MTEAITENEAQELLSMLDKELRDAIPEHLPINAGFPEDWNEPVTVLDLIQSEIAEGRPVIRRVRVSDGEFDRLTGTQRAAQGTSADLAGSEQYTAIEELSLTNEALQLVFISPVQMASRTMSSLIKFGTVDCDDISVKFAAKKEEEPSPVLELDAHIINVAVEAASPLAELLSKLDAGLGMKKNLTLEPVKS